MWRTIKYTVRISGYRNVAMALLLFGGVAYLAVNNTNHSRFLAFTTHLAIASMFLSSILTALDLKPEDTPAMEMYNTLPHPFWRITAQHLAVTQLAMLLPAILVTLAIMGEGQHTALALLGIANVVSNNLLFGGISLLGTVLGRNSKIGQLSGLLMFIFSLLVRLPEFINPAVYPYRVSDGLNFPTLWWSIRLAYATLGVMLFAGSLYLMQDSDRLMVGKAPRSISRATPKKVDRGRKSPPLTALSQTLRISSPRFLGLVTYEALLTSIDGVVPILLLVLCVLCSYVFPLLESIQGGFEELLTTQATSPAAFVYLLFPFLPLILADSLPHDRRSASDQLVLTTISPREYLGGKALGTCGAVLGTFLLINAPVLLFLALVAFTGAPHFLLCYLGILLLGVLPAMVYISAMSVLIGALARSRRALFLGGLMTLGYLVLIFITQNNVAGNVLFPSGLMAAETLTAWLQQQMSSISTIYVTNDVINTIVPLSYLVFPILSAIVQIGLTWFFVGGVLEKEITTA